MDQPSSDGEVVARFERAQESLVLQAVDLSLETVARMVDEGLIDTEPGYQRRERWNRDRQSALIESFLLNIPVPPIYLAEDGYGTYSVIDGKQRVTAVRDFLRGDYGLTGLADFTALNGVRFEGLPAPLSNALRVRPYLRAVTLLAQSDPELRYEVFTRLNTGGEPLNAQEIRNVVFRGPLNDLIMTLSEQPFLRQQLKIHSRRSQSYRTMLDVEFVLRFLALADFWRSFSGDFRRSMDMFMLQHEDASARALTTFRNRFDGAIGVCAELWGNHAFRRPATGGWRDQTIAGMYDAQMVSASLLSDETVETLKPRTGDVLQVTRNLFDDPDFDASVREGTNTPARVRYRIERMVAALEELAAS